MIRLTEAQTERFLDRIDRSDDPEACWTWTGTQRRGGYGAVRTMDGMRQAHRVMWTLTNGEIPDGMILCHTCDNPKCVNPNHLWLGTHATNAADRQRKNRSAIGERHGSRTKPERILRGQHAPGAKLCPSDVFEIRRLYQRGVNGYVTLAKQFNVSTFAIRQIVNGRTWRHV